VQSEPTPDDAEITFEEMTMSFQEVMKNINHLELNILN